MNIWERVAADQAQGELWKARDRLAGAVANQGADPALLDALAKVHLAMHDLPAAGRCWYLTDRNDDDAQEARAAFGNRYGNEARAMLNALHIKAPITEYPQVVQDRLNALIDQTVVPGSDQPHWLEPAKRTRGHVAAPTRKLNWREKLSEALLIFGLLGVWLIGAFAIISLIVYGVLQLF